MSRSQILSRLASKDMDLEKGLNFLLVLAEKMKLEEDRAWAFNELNGYPAASQLPRYRVLKAGRIIYSGVHGQSVVDSVPLALNIFPPEIRSCLNQNHVNNPLRDLIKFSKSQELLVEKDLTLLAYEVFHLSGIRAEEIKMQFESINFVNLLGHIRADLLDRFIEIEKNHGSLDGLYIQLIRDADAKKQRDIIEALDRE